MTPENKSVPSVMSDPSVSTLESLVPPQDLCKQIPEGKFENSTLVWTFDDRLMPRTIMIEGVRHYYRGFPAPILQEILAEFHNFHLEKFGKDNPCSIIVKRDPENFSHYFANHSPVVAALKLWLELNSTPSIPSIPSIPTQEDPIP